MSDIHPKVYAVAKERFRDDFEKSYPQPTRASAPPKPTMSAFWQNRMVQVCFAILTAALLMSALRTFHVLSTVGAAIEGASGVIVIEGVAGFISFFLVLQKYKETRKVHNAISGWMSALVLASIALALLTNIYSMMIYQDKQLSAVEWLLFILAGSIAVFSIAILSHILGTLYVQNLSEHEQELGYYRSELNAIDSDYKDAVQEWANAMEDKWKTSQKKWIGMVNNLYQQEQGISAVSNQQYVQPVQQSSAMASVQYRSNERTNERTIGFAGLIQPSKPEQIARILQADAELASKPYSVILEDERIAAITTTKATISAAFKLFNQPDGE